MSADMQVTATLARGLSILDAFRSARSPLRHRDIVAHTALPKATVTRLIRTLCDQGYLDKHEGDTFRLGDRLLTLGAISIDQSPLVTAAAPKMAVFAETYKARSVLSVFSEGKVSTLQEWGEDMTPHQYSGDDPHRALVDLAIEAALGVAPSGSSRADTVSGRQAALGRARYALGTIGFLTTDLVTNPPIHAALVAPIKVEGNGQMSFVSAISSAGELKGDIKEMGEALARLARQLRRIKL